MATQVFVVVFMLRISSANYLPCLLIPHERSGPRSVSDLYLKSFHIIILIDNFCIALFSRVPNSLRFTTFSNIF